MNTPYESPELSDREKIDRHLLAMADGKAPDGRAWVLDVRKGASCAPYGSPSTKKDAR